MASFYNTTVGQQVEFQRVLATAGFTAADVIRVIKDPQLADAMYKSIQVDMPSWWRSPRQQLKRAHQLWPNTALPEPPEDFAPRTAYEVLLLHVPDTFDALWNRVVAPPGYDKHWSWEISSNERRLRLAPNKVKFEQPVWLAFDPEHGHGERPDSFWGQKDIAASEIFSAVIQFPDWPLAWGSSTWAPNLSGYQYRQGADWSEAPYLYCSSDSQVLGLYIGQFDDPNWSSPRVRKC